jgi:hypothetical protein
MDVDRDRGGGGGPEGEGGDDDADEAGGLDLQGAIEEARAEDARGDPEIAAFLDDGDDGGGVSDVDAVFEEFEEGSVEEVIAADDEEPEDEFAEATDDDVKNLFGDLSAVELDPDGETPGDDGGTTADAAGADADASSGVPPRDPEETANEVEGLFDDLSGIDVPEEDEPSTGTAQTQATVLDTGADAAEAFADDDTGGFQWLGEDVHIFSADEADVDGVFEEYEARSVEELIAPGEEDATPGVSATAMYDDLAAGRLPGAAAGDGPGTASGWGATDGADPDGVAAMDLYDGLGSEAPAVAGVGADAADGEGADPDTAGGDEIDLDDLDPGEELDLSLDEDDGTASAADATPDAPATPAGDSTEDASADPAGATAEPSAPARPREDVSDVTPDLDAAGGEGPEMDSESDVDAIFERFEESTPEEVIAAAEDPDETEAGSVADETVERLFGDLSGVELETEAAGEAEEAAAAPEPGSEAAESEVEGLLGDLSAVDVEADRDAEPATEVTAETSVGPPADPADGLLERTGADTHVVVGESDVDAVFERFEEGSPEEILDSVAESEAATGDETAAADAFGTDDAVEELPEDDAEEDDDADDPETADDDGSGGIVARIKGLFAGLFGR